MTFVAWADEPLSIAVASNFKVTADEIVAEFSNATGIPVRVSSGSTGKLYAQIVHGAPYDVLLAADSERPALLEEKGYAVVGSRVTYAVGALILWSANQDLSEKNCRAVLGDGSFKWLAIANPKTAPYGRAAKEFLLSAGLWDEVESRVVYGENISQALQFAATGNATLALLAVSQTRGDRAIAATCSWRVPAATHARIVQQAVVISNSEKLVAARRFLDFLQGSLAADILQRHGYGEMN